MTTSYETGLSIDRQISQYGTSHHTTAPPPDMVPSSAAEPMTLRPPSANAIGTHRADSTVFQRAWAEAQNAAEKLDAYLGSLTPLIDDQRYTEANIREHIAAFANTPAGKATEASLQAVQKMADDAQAAAVQARQNLMQPGDSAAELRNTRYWNRVERTLDNTKSGSYTAAVDALIADASPDEIGVLMQELPSYLQTKGLHDTSWIDDLIGQKVPEYGAAQRRAVAAQQARTIAERNAKALRDRYSSAYPTRKTPGQRTSLPMVFPDKQYDPELI